MPLLRVKPVVFLSEKWYTTGHNLYVNNLQYDLCLFRLMGVTGVLMHFFFPYQHLTFSESGRDILIIYTSPHPFYPSHSDIRICLWVGRELGEGATFSILSCFSMIGPLGWYISDTVLCISQHQRCSVTSVVCWYEISRLPVNSINDTHRYPNTFTWACVFASCLLRRRRERDETV